MASVRTRGRRHMAIHQGVSYGTYATRDAARTAALNVELRDRLGVLHRPKAETFGDAVARYVERKERELAPRSIQAIHETRKKLAPLSDVPLPALTVATVEDTISDIARTAPRRAQMCLKLVKAVLRGARLRGQQIDEATLELRPPKHTARKGQAISLGEAFELGSWLPDIAARLPAVALLTGMRQGELFSLTAQDWDRKGRRVFIRSGKTEAATRWVDLCAEAHKLLVAQAWQARVLRSPWLFPNRSGARWTKDTFGAPWRKARDSAGLPGFRFHWLRHSYITLCRRAGVPVEVIARQVGHADGGALIFRVYRHVGPNETILTARLLDEFLGVEIRREAVR